MTNDILASTLAKLTHDIDAYRACVDMRRFATLASVELAAGDPAVGGEGLASSADALRTLSNALASRARARANERASQYGWQVATYDIAPVAQESGEQAVAWLTGNAYMPPIRSLANAEALWQMCDTGGEFGGDLWAVFIERVESRLNELNVLMEAPEFDNALYVVDLTRFEHLDEFELDELAQRRGGDHTLEDEWRAIATDNASPSEG